MSTCEHRIDLAGRVAIVTGAGGGLGRQHALLLARCGARVVVNDLGDAAQAVAAEIVAAGGQARALQCSVTDADAVQAMVDAVLAEWGRVDILVNNAGILRDKSFAKMPLDDFRAVVDVHLMGAANCTKAVWDAMRAQAYGRIVMTTSSSGLYGNFGQANYAAAKMALVGLMQTLALEGAKHGIKVNCLAPTAYTRMMEGIARHPHHAFHQHARAAAHDGLGHGPLAVDLRASAPTRRVPEGWPKRTALRCRRRQQVDQVPGTAAAVAMATAPCPSSRGAACPSTSARTSRSTSHRCACRWTPRSPAAAPRRRSSACAGAWRPRRRP
jgi:NAD(P)-dependent dehydrogenase (short-subunit alcohol dehydrogenase family)